MSHHEKPPAPSLSARTRPAYGPRGRLRTAALGAALAAASCTLAGCHGIGTASHAAGTGDPQARAAAPSAAKPSAKPTATASARPLAGKVVAVDPGHNPDNHLHTAEINKQVAVGNGHKECDTTGTSTNDGYAEADFTLDVAHRLRTLLEKQGAKVVLTYDGDRPWGPCVTERAEAGNKAGADAALSIHADGAPVGRRGFHVIMPGRVDEGGADTTSIVRPSHTLGTDLRNAFQRVTGSARSNYIGGGTGLDTRTDLGGLNLSTVPKVFIECGNMRDPKDAALLKSPAWRQKAALGMAEGIENYLK